MLLPWVLGVVLVSQPGPQAGSVAAPRPIDAGVLRRMFLDLLGRPPLDGERERWVGRERAELLDELLGTDAFWQNWIDEQLYYFLLIDNFRPAGESIQRMLGQLAGGGLGVREALHRLCLSSSFDRRNPGPDTFVTVVMEQLLGITVQKATRELEIGKKVYDGSPGTFLGRPGSSQADVVHIAIADDRCLDQLLRREHERLLRREPTDPELAAWCVALERDELAFGSILRSWLLSPAYDDRLSTRRPQPNRLFIRALFVDLVGRLPDEVETQRIRSALDGLADSGPLRALVARLLLDSGKAPAPQRGAIPDPGAWIQQLFERLLGRPPGPDERTAFHEAFRDPACRPETVLYAIVSHPEYQTW